MGPPGGGDADARHGDDRPAGDQLRADRMRRQWGRRRRRHPEAGVQAAGSADDLLLQQHPAHLHRVVCPRRLPRRPGPDGAGGSLGGSDVRADGQREVGPAADPEALPARQARSQLHHPEDRGRAQHRGAADAAGMSGRAAERRQVPHARQHRRHPAVGDRMRDEQLSRRLGRVAVLALGLIGLLASRAAAEPYLMVREGAKCSACHTNETGGGKRTAFAHIHAHDIEHDLELLPVPPGTKPFNGEVNSYVSIGGDLRVRNSTIFQDKPDALGRVPENNPFRRGVLSNDSTVNEVLGFLQVDLWPDMATFYLDENLNGGASTREAFGLLHNFLPRFGVDWFDWLITDQYIKAGKMFPPLRLRVHDHEAVIRALRAKYAAYGEVALLLLDWLNLRGTFDFVKVTHNNDQTRYAIGAEPFISRVIQPRIQYRINNGPGSKPGLNQDELRLELHFFF